MFCLHENELKAILSHWTKGSLEDLVLNVALMSKKAARDLQFLYLLLILFDTGVSAYRHHTGHSMQETL